ncbi:hypothetical protein IVB30_11540 [Bradyrhizobium sp. 200]|uniref:hypothetical protein n=1 Tax=Bradyrhizobium sp. 200 TaxID=2782665 RepID=UPI001FFFF3C0|nr:hypothetical protein [Bradyrhizobium sp. 200]UPJ51916.1 hypothetical protein IVB30_11540 [Bradyrhizobium sp. 200]
MSIDDGYRAGVPLASSRTDASDNYAYFSLLKRGISSCRHQVEALTEPLQGNPLACTYIGGLALGNVFWTISQWLSPSKRIAVSILLILNAAAIPFTFLWALDAVLRRTFSFITATILAGTILFTLDNFALSFYAQTFYLDFYSVLSLEPGFARLVNPSLFWALGFATIALLLHQMQRTTAIGFAVLFVIAVACGAAGLAVSACILFGCCLFVAADLLLARRINWPVFGSSIGLVIGLSFSYWQLHQFRATDLGKALLHGQVLDLRLNWAMLWLAVPIAFGKIVPDDPARNLLIKCLLAAAAIIGLVSDSFELGSRLWLRGSAAIAFIACVAWLWSRGEMLVRRIPNVAEVVSQIFRKRPRTRILTSSLVLVFLSVMAATARPPQLDKARGFIDRDKLDVLTWLAGNTRHDTLVASTSIEDSFLIEFYTNGAPFVPLYGLTVLPREMQLGRYFYVLDLIREGDEVVERLSAVRKSALDEYNQKLKLGLATPPDHATYESLAFYHMLLYYPFSRDISGIFEADKVVPNFLKWLEEVKAASRSQATAFDYLILRADEHLKQMDPFEVVFRNASYVIVRSRHRTG